MAGSAVRNAGLVAAGAGVLGLSFWITLIIIDSTDLMRRGSSRSVDPQITDVPLTNEDGTPRRSRFSVISDLPPIPASPPAGAAVWDGLDGLNAKIIAP